MPPRYTAIYARVSSEQQTSEKTIASQIAALEARVAQDDLALAPDNRFVDEGYSGATLVRPALERLRDAVAAGGLDRLYVHSPDRLARRYAYQVLLIDEFRRAGVEVVFLNRPIGLSPEDDLLLQVQGMVAEYERAKILERSRRGKRHAARQGAVSVLSGAPYGYRYIGKREGGGVARYEIMADEAQIVRLIFEWIGCERVSIGEVCRRLRQQGCPTRSGKSTWDRTTVWGLLKNPAYAGTAAFGKTRIGPMPTRLRAVRGGSDQPRRASGVYAAAPSEWMGVPVPALVEGALFEAAQEQLAENRHRRRQQARGERYLLQGLAVCRQCGYAYYGKPVSLRSAKGKRRTYAYYRCCGSDAYRFGGQRVCSNAQVRTDQLDAAVWREVERLLQDPSWIAAEYERRLAREGAPGAGDLAGIEAQIAKLRRGMGRLIDSYAEGLIDKAEFEPRITGLRQRIQGWEEQAVVVRDEAEQRAALSLIVGRLEDFARQVRERVASVDWRLQRDLIRTLVKRVEIDREDVNVVLRVTPSPIDPGSHDPGGERVLQHRGRSDHPTLRRPSLPRSDAPVRHPLGRFQPSIDVQKHPRTIRMFADRTHKQIGINAVEKGLDIEIEDPWMPPASLPRHSDRIERRFVGSISIGIVVKVRFHERFQEPFDYHLGDAISDCRNPERPRLPIPLG
jgi:site-specific DNA recombinase